MFLRRAIRYLAVINFALGTVLVAVEISITVRRSSEITLGDPGTMESDITALCAGVFTAATGALMLFVNEKPPGKKASNRLYHTGSCLLAGVSLALLIGTLALFYKYDGVDTLSTVDLVKSLTGASAEQELSLLSSEFDDALQSHMNAATVFAFILLFTMVTLFILFVSSWVMGRDQPEANRHAERIQKYRQRLSSPGSTFADFYHATLEESLDAVESSVSDHMMPLPKFDPRPNLSFRPYLELDDRGKSPLSGSIDTMLSEF